MQKGQDSNENVLAEDTSILIENEQREVKKNKKLGIIAFTIFMFLLISIVTIIFINFYLKTKNKTMRNEVTNGLVKKEISANEDKITSPFVSNTDAVENKTEKINIDTDLVIQNIEFGGSDSFNKITINVLPGWYGVIENDYHKNSTVKDFLLIGASLSLINEKDDRYSLIIKQGMISGSRCSYPDDVIEDKEKFKVREYGDYTTIKDQDGVVYKIAMVSYLESDYHGTFELCSPNPEMEEGLYYTPTISGRIEYNIAYRSDEEEINKNIINEMDIMISSIKSVDKN